MIRSVLTELAALVYFISGGSLYALIYRFTLLLSESSHTLIKRTLDLLSGLTSGVIFVLITDVFFKGILSFYSVAIYVISSFIFVKIFASCNLPSREFVSGLKNIFHKIFDFGKLKTKLQKPINKFLLKLKIKLSPKKSKKNQV